MQSRHQTSASPHLGGKTAVVLFIFVLLAFVIESELTQYVQTTLNYRQPFFLFYIVHSSFSIIFPLHLLYLLATTDYTTVSLCKGLAIAITKHLDPAQKSINPRFPHRKFIRLTLIMTMGITCPALLWFAAVSLASIIDANTAAIWNTNAFFAYIISVKLFKLRWETKRLLAVVLATLGTLIVVYGGSTAGDGEGHLSGASASLRPSAPLIGCLLTLVASFGYGLYQVLYKIYAALPSDPEVIAERLYQEIPEGDDDEALSQNQVAIESRDAIYPPPFGLHPNLLTSMMGFFTCIVLWIPIPFLHWSGAEVFHLPPNALTVFAIIGICLSGVVFNAGFMVLLGVWGPIIVSVGNLLTIVLVLIADVLFGGGMAVVTIWSLLGCGIIVLAFAVLSYDMFVKQS
ncbi:hypothetical protein CVT24_004332 [Panaeolus cyanescens]|uniref:EamA domain-containing protein n=1 Tax=Panaeolus cyanescens TaxID=181874 RepID=A0A409VE46_9AGAR|nr:hypothetical protein CVT24_004332 [Panaeolus cyanescens]